MPKETLSTRVKQLEKDHGEMNSWLHNGFTDKVARIIGDVLTERQKDEWQHERDERKMDLEELKVSNAAKGNERDRLVKIVAAILTFLGSGSVIGLILLLLKKG